MALHHISVLDQLGPALRSDLVTANPHQRRLVEFADTFLVERRTLPQYGDYEVWLSTLPEGVVREGTREAWQRVAMISTAGYNPEYFAEQVVNDLQLGAARVAKARLNTMTDVDPATLQDLADRVASVKVDRVTGLGRLDDVGRWAGAAEAEVRWPTGFPTLDQTLAGGWGTELVLVFADSGVGKSLWLQNVSVAAARRGKHVLHVSLEIGLRPQMHRYYRQIALMDRASWVRDPDEGQKRVHHFLRLSKGSVQVVEFPAYGLDPDGLSRLAARVSRNLPEGETLGAIVVDYLDLLAPSSRWGGGKGSRGEYTDLGRLTHEVRSLSGAYECTLFAASQAVRKPEKSSRLSLRDMGDSYQKVRAADIILSLVQTEEEAALHQGRLGILKARDTGGHGTEVPLYINRDLALIAELDHPNTVAVMQQLGHLPGVPASPPAPPTPVSPAGVVP